MTVLLMPSSFHIFALIILKTTHEMIARPSDIFVCLCMCVCVFDKQWNHQTRKQSQYFLIVLMSFFCSPRAESTAVARDTRLPRHLGMRANGHLCSCLRSHYNFCMLDINAFYKIKAQDQYVYTQTAVFCILGPCSAQHMAGFFVFVCELAGLTLMWSTH